MKQELPPSPEVANEAFWRVVAELVAEQATIEKERRDIITYYGD